jgi:hypothetical protein
VVKLTAIEVNNTAKQQFVNPSKPKKFRVEIRY